MRIKLIIILFIVCLKSSATTYYLSNSGDNSNDGISTTSTWQTVTKINGSSFLKGDSILFKGGETFIGGITKIFPSNVYIGSYGTGTKPIITGLSTITAWTNLGSNIWESTGSVSTLPTLSMVLVNGINTPMGRYPNTGYLTFQSYSGNTTITSSSLTGTPDWTGGEVVIRKQQWILDRFPITAQSGSTLTYTGSGVNPTNGYGFFIQADSLTLDQQNEWYYSPYTKKLRVYSTTQPTSVRVASIETLMFPRGNNLTIDGIELSGSNSYILDNEDGNADSLSVINCNLKYAGIDAIKFAGIDKLLIENDTINHTNNNAITLFFANNNSTIRNNVILNTATQPGMGKCAADAYISGTETHSGIILSQGTGSLIEYNTIINTGYDAINFIGDSIVIKNNFIDSFCLVVQDGAGIYTREAIWNGRKILSNIITNGIGSISGTSDNNFYVYGIYLDDKASNIYVDSNTVANCTGAGSWGVFFHNATNITLTANNVYNNTSQFASVHNTGNPIMSGMIIKKNIFFSKNNSQTNFTFSSNAFDFTQFGLVDSNYLVRNIENKNIVSASVNSSSSFSNYTLGEWRNYTSLDMHSPVRFFNSSREIIFQYNKTKSNQLISLPVSYWDEKGIIKTLIITLKPFKSTILTQSGDIKYIKRSGSLLKINGKHVVGEY